MHLSVLFLKPRHKGALRWSLSQCFTIWLNLRLASGGRRALEETVKESPPLANISTFLLVFILVFLLVFLAWVSKHFHFSIGISNGQKVPLTGSFWDTIKMQKTYNCKFCKQNSISIFIVVRRAYTSMTSYLLSIIGPFRPYKPNIPEHELCLSSIQKSCHFLGSCPVSMIFDIMPINWQLSRQSVLPPDFYLGFQTWYILTLLYSSVVGPGGNGGLQHGKTWPQLHCKPDAPEAGRSRPM